MNTEKKKRTRVTTVSLDKTVDKLPEPQIEVKVETSGSDEAFYDDNGEFMWDAYEATCPSRTRKPNPHIKTKKGDKVFSRETYAQSLYDIMENMDRENPMIPTLHEGSIYEGKIFGINSEFITVDVGYRELVYVKYAKETDLVKALKPGEEASVLITIVKDNSHILGSISGGVKHKVFLDLRAGVEEGNTAWVGIVKNMIENGGYIVEVQGVECFMPGSLAGINKLHDFKSIIGTEMYVVPVSFSPDRGTIVVSHRKYLQAMIPTEIQNIKDDMGVECVGNVTGTAKYGVFVEFNRCLTGMIHVNDLTPEMLKKHKSREIQPGDDINFRIKEVVSDTKIILTQLETVPVIDPWEGIEQRIQVPSEVVGVVKAVKDYGIFIDVEPGIAGLLHISEIQDLIDTSTIKSGDNITVQVTRIDSATRKIFLKI